MGRGGKASKDALVGKEVRAGADRQEGPLADGVFPLQLGKGVNEAQRLGLLFNDLISVPAEDDKNVVVLELVVGLFVGDLTGKRDVLVGED